MKKNKITAVLGPTNTGKTFLAIETMLGFDSGMIGFPLRLLAREVYDKVIEKVDIKKVALITGEEKIIPTDAKYFLCTVESMPIDKNLEFVGIDEIQMCSDPERGHIFTDRLLSLRGEKLTMFMGSNTIKNIISKLEGDIEFISKERLSKLDFTGHKKISRIENFFFFKFKIFGLIICNPEKTKSLMVLKFTSETFFCGSTKLKSPIPL